MSPAFYFCLILMSTVLVNFVQTRPRPTIGFFPSHPHPWSYDDDDLKYNRYIQKYRNSLEHFEEPIPEETVGGKFPIYTTFEDGFVPRDLTALDSVYWWKKRFNGLKAMPSYDDDDDSDSRNNEISNMVGPFYEDTVNKRDYTAAQLVNLLKALAKARRQKQVRIVGKGLRFGISK